MQSVGQRLGASVVVTHIHRVASNQMNNYSMSLANVGDVEAVLCRRGDAVVLTNRFTTGSNRDECFRVYKSDGIITEDGKVNGTTRNTRLLGCAFLYPHVVPDPYTCTVTLRHDDEFIIIANHGLWKFVGYDEAVQEVYEIGNPIVAAKKLQDLAQGFGSKENIAVLVIRLNTDSQPSLGRLRKNRSMSIDDVEAAAQHQARMHDVPHKLRASTGKLKRQAPTVPVVINFTEPEPMPDPYLEQPDAEMVPVEGRPDMVPDADTVDGDEYVRRTINVDGSPMLSKRSPNRSPMSQSPIPELKPLPNQRFRKKTAASEWETLLQKRLADEVKDKEIRHMSQTIGDSDDELDVDRVIIGPDLDMTMTDAHSEVASGERENWSSQMIGSPVIAKKTSTNAGSKGKFGSVGRNTVITTPWTDASNRKPNTANPAYFEAVQEGDPEVIVTPTPPLTTNGTKGDRPKVSRMIGMFENINRQSLVPAQQNVRQSFRSQNHIRTASRDRSHSGDRTLLHENGRTLAEPEIPIYSQSKKNRYNVHPSKALSEPPEDRVIVEIARL